MKSGALLYTSWVILGIYSLPQRHLFLLHVIIMWTNKRVAMNRKHVWLQYSSSHAFQLYHKHPLLPATLNSTDYMWDCSTRLWGELHGQNYLCAPLKWVSLNQITLSNRPVAFFLPPSNTADCWLPFSNKRVWSVWELLVKAEGGWLHWPLFTSYCC